MSEVFDNILGQLSKWGEVAVDKSGFYFKKAIDKGEEFSKISRIQLDIEKEKRKIRQRLTELGKYVYDQTRISAAVDFSDDEEYKQLVAGIDEGKAAIEKLEVQKQEIKSKEPETQESEQSDTDPIPEDADVLDIIIEENSEKEK